MPHEPLANVRKAGRTTAYVTLPVAVLAGWLFGAMVSFHWMIAAAITCLGFMIAVLFTVALPRLWDAVATMRVNWWMAAWAWLIGQAAQLPAWALAAQRKDLPLLGSESLWAWLWSVAEMSAGLAVAFGVFYLFAARDRFLTSVRLAEQAAVDRYQLMLVKGEPFAPDHDAELARLHRVVDELRARGVVYGRKAFEPVPSAVDASLYVD
jgi:hypothetical protein